MQVLYFATIGLGLFALIHAVRQRSDAFPAVDKLSKPIWLAILGGSLLVMLVFAQVLMVWLIAVIAIGVYLVDVRPRVDEVQRGPRW